jgi:hypothetical protein
MTRGTRHTAKTARRLYHGSGCQSVIGHVANVDLESETAQRPCTMRQIDSAAVFRVPLAGQLRDMFVDTALSSDTVCNVYIVSYTHGSCVDLVSSWSPARASVPDQIVGGRLPARALP